MELTKNQKQVKNPEQDRMKENSLHLQFWKQWGPYLSERQWGTIREDYSSAGDAWNHTTHDQARSLAYRWGEEGIAGISDHEQQLCFALTLWNGRDPILKERLFGLAGPEGNHGEDVKESYYYLDNTPTHSYMKYLYQYPQTLFPYDDLLATNRNRSKMMPEYELPDTGVFEDQRYFDVLIEYAKRSPTDIAIRITVFNRSDSQAKIVLIPTLWFRNTWSFDRSVNKPEIRKGTAMHAECLIACHDQLGEYFLAYEPASETLVTDNETNVARLYQVANPSPYVKDAFHEVLIGGNSMLLAGKTSGTKAAPVYHDEIEPHGSRVVHLQLAQGSPDDFSVKQLDEVFTQRIADCDLFYRQLTDEILSSPDSDSNTGEKPSFSGKIEVQFDKNADRACIFRQALSGLLWNKQYYNYEVETWLKGDKGAPAPPVERQEGRNASWKHLFNRDIISMPDKWEYPWYATWDSAFHCVSLVLVDPDYAKKQLLLFLREWYMHPNGQLPAYEWALGDANPPVHAWACLRVYQMEKEMTGHGDRDFLERAFHKLLLNFTWWVNRKDADGLNIFQGGFLGLDNIGPFDRSKPLPTSGHLDQVDGTSWMARYALDMMMIALELAQTNSAYEDMAVKFLDHFIRIAEAFNNFNQKDGISLWDEEDGFFYDTIRYPDGRTQAIKVRSLVGLIPLLAVAELPVSALDQFPGFAKRLRWFRENRASVNEHLFIGNGESGKKLLFSLVNKGRLLRILLRLSDDDEFLSPYGIRSLSKYHAAHPFTIQLSQDTYTVDYQPGESTNSLFGGNSNWRGPIWLPINYLLLQSIKTYASYYGHDIEWAFPHRSNHQEWLDELFCDLSERLLDLFHQERTRPAQKEPFIEDLHLFYEYFHGETGQGLGASHQTGWTALIANLILEMAEQQAKIGSAKHALPDHEKKQIKE